tara:strand:+ start:2329 stop:2502 length:174 start_codon:yes stop_codon:yes gene_type:complete
MSKRKLNKENHSYKQIDGEEVVPIFYYSRNSKFMAAARKNGSLVVDGENRPVPYKSI